MRETTQKRNRDRGDRFLLFLFAVACGFINWLFLKGDPFLSHPIIDAAEYLAESRAIVAGIPLWESVPIHGPSYPLFLTPILLLLGPNPTAVFFLQILLVAISSLLIRAAGVKVLGRLPGNLAGVLLAAAPPILYFEVQVLPVVLQVFLHSVIVYLLIVRGPGARKCLLWAGICSGLSYLTHPGVGIFLLLLIGLVIRGAGSLRASSPLLAGLLISLFPASILNLRASGSPLPIQGNAGLNLYIGNGENSNGTPHVRPGYAWERLTARPLLDGVEGGFAQSSYFLRKSVESFERDPGSFLGRLAAKALLFASAHPIDASHDPVYFRERSPLQRFFLLDAAILVPLAVGFLLARPPIASRFSVAAAGLLGYWIATTLSVFAVRYRAPVWPLLALLAVAFPFSLPSLTRARRVVGGAAAIGLFLLALSDPFHYGGYNPVRTEFNMGRLLYARGNLVEAKEWFQRARSRNRQDPDPANALGVLAMARGDLQRADSCFHEAIDLAPDYADVHYNRALLSVREGREGEAEEGLREAIRLSPSHAAAHYSLGLLLQRRGEIGDAERSYRKAVYFDPTRDDAWTALGAVLATRRSYDEAETCFRRALKLNPKSAEANANLRRLLSMRSGG